MKICPCRPTLYSSLDAHKRKQRNRYLMNEPLGISGRDVKRQRYYSAFSGIFSNCLLFFNLIVTKNRRVNARPHMIQNECGLICMSQKRININIVSPCRPTLKSSHHLYQNQKRSEKQNQNSYLNVHRFTSLKPCCRITCFFSNFIASTMTRKILSLTNAGPRKPRLGLSGCGHGGLHPDSEPSPDSVTARPGRPGRSPSEAESVAAAGVPP